MNTQKGNRAEAKQLEVFENENKNRNEMRRETARKKNRRTIVTYKHVQRAMNVPT